MNQRYIIGARGSRLSMAQTRGAADFLKAEFPGTEYRIVAVETPGDRDLTTPIERSAPDFFTRDLDDAVREGRVDFAVHSAKDLPERIADDLDWFWLPNREEPCDCLVFRKNLDDDRPLRIGVSSERRREYALKRYPDAEVLPIRGAIDARLAQLKPGGFDAVIMAKAALNRLYFSKDAFPETVSHMMEIPLSELEPPEAQGYLAVVFRAGDERLLRMRERFATAVRFVSAGVGDAGMCTVAGVRDL